MDRSKQLGEESIGKLLLRFSVPAIVGMLVNALYNMVDRIFIGHIPNVGSIAISGIAVGFPLSIINMAFAMLIGIGSSTMVSIKLGEKKKEEAEKILGNAIVLDVMISLIISIVGLAFLDSILKVFGASNVTLPYARNYMKYIIGGALLQNIGFGMNNIIRAEGSPKIAMITMIIGAIMNTILDPILIFGFNMGVRGAAIATIISQGISSVWVIYYFLSKRSILKFKKENLRLNIHTVKTIFSIGMSPFFMQLASSIVTTLYNTSLIKYGGDLAVGAMGIINSIIMLFFMPIFGINQGAQPIIGYNYGAKQYKRVKKALKLAIIAGVCIATFGFIIIQLFPKALISIFNKEDAELIAISVHGIRIDMIALPIIGFQIISSNYFQAIGKAKIAIVLSLSRQVIVLIPILLILPPILKLDGVWMAGPISDVLSATLTGVFLYKDMKLLKTKV
ncbi:MATE family efflux transporter [Clostridium rectalis]|uniref:MATE family efflux transporter n=1 Tax=Clostridium rectalis TaxID=2040295 RepID=UPI000F63131A|nr:MATE family efflux transporter [Clostridium rectalis]